MAKKKSVNKKIKTKEKTDIKITLKTGDLKDIIEKYNHENKHYKQPYSEEIEDLFTHLKTIKAVVIDDIHYLKSQRTELYEINQMSNFLSANDITSVKLFSGRGDMEIKSHAVMHGLKKYLLMIANLSGSTGPPPNGNAGNPKGELLTLLIHSVHIIRAIQKADISDDFISYYLGVENTGTFKKKLRIAEKANYFPPKK